MGGSMFRIAAAVVTAGAALTGCSESMRSLSRFGGGGEQPPPSAAAAIGPVGRPSIAAEDIVGRWGIAAFHRPEDQPRTEAAARGQCSQPYAINRGSEGVAMLGHDNPQMLDMMIKASADGRTYIGPGPEPGGADDREVASFDGRVLVLKWVDPEVAGRYGTMVLVRCGAPGAPKTAKKPSKSG